MAQLASCTVEALAEYRTKGSLELTSLSTVKLVSVLPLGGPRKHGASAGGGRISFSTSCIIGVPKAKGEGEFEATDATADPWPSRARTSRAAGMPG
jgi:hypothetical protein